MLCQLRYCALLCAALLLLPVASAPAAVPGGDVPPDSVEQADDDPADAATDSDDDEAADLWYGPWTDGDVDVEDAAVDYVGMTGGASPYHVETPLSFTPPPVRYNRVDGFVVGLRRDGLERSGDDRARLYGQLGYAFGQMDVRYTAGGEVRVYDAADSGLLVGARYREETVTEDAWKTSVLENSLAAAVSGDDFFDYYEAEGARVYARQFLPGGLALHAGFRVEEHRSLDATTTWSVFGSQPGVNPAIDEGRMHSAVAALEGGSVTDLDGLPSGYAFRVAAEIGDGLGGDFGFNRYVADGRAYLPVAEDVRLNLRLRGGYATASAPLQKRFALGGVGSMRGYGQNAFTGTRAALGSAEVLFGEATVMDGVAEDVFLAGFVDAGWTGTAGERFAVRDVYPSAGFGIGLDERSMRLDVAWPLRDTGAGQRPSLRLRITPHF